MTEEEKRQEILNAMEFIEVLDALTEVNTAMSCIPFDALTPEMWSEFRSALAGTAGFLTQVKVQTVPAMSKIIENDAFSAHLQAVLNAPE